MFMGSLTRFEKLKWWHDVVFQIRSIYQSGFD